MKPETVNSATAVKDPVCGMSVNPATAKHRLEHGGASRYFCCAGCAEKVKADPEKYLSQTPRPNSSSLITLGAPAVRSTPAQPTPSSVNHSVNQLSNQRPAD